MRVLLDAAKLRTVLFNKGMNQKELAEVSGISRNTINMIMNGKSCSEVTANAICQALGIRQDDATK